MTNINETEARFRFAIEASDIGVWDWNMQTNKMFYYNKCKEILGLESDEMLYSYEQWKGLIHPDDLSRVVSNIQKHLNGEEYTLEYRLKNKAGNYKWFVTRGKILTWDKQGNPLRMIGIIVDISARKKVEEELRNSEEKFRLLYSAMSQGVALHEIIVDANGDPIDYRYLDVNSSFEKILGLKSEKIIGRTVKEIMPEVESYWIKEFGQVALSGQAKNFENYSHILSRYFEVFAYSPKKGQFAVLATDITERKIREKELREQYEELTAIHEELAATEEELRTNYEQLEKAKEQTEKATKAKSQFLANMSHEIRTPMNGIIGVVDLLESTTINDEQREYLKILKSSSYLLLDIINNVLDFSKIEAGKLKLNNKPFLLKEEINKMINEFSIIGHKKGLEIMYHLDPYINDNLIGDVMRLNQVLINIMNNAIKFTEKGHIILKVKKISSLNEKIKLQFCIEDTGIGISEDFKKDIFKIFSQEDYSYNKKYSGTGLGLAISKQIINLLNGDIWFESVKDKGSIFYFTAEFFMQNTYNIVKNLPPSKKKTNIGETLSLTPTVMVVEDNEINKYLAIKLLSNKKLETISAANGKEALELLEKNKVDMILMDIQMPELNGFEATKIIREKEKISGFHLPIIAMTAYAMQGDKEKSLEMGMDDYISKPFNKEELYKKIEKWLGFIK